MGHGEFRLRWTIQRQIWNVWYWGHSPMMKGVVEKFSSISKEATSDAGSWDVVRLVRKLECKITVTLAIWWVFKAIWNVTISCVDRSGCFGAPPSINIDRGEVKTASSGLMNTRAFLECFRCVTLSSNLDLEEQMCSASLHPCKRLICITKA